MYCQHCNHIVTDQLPERCFECRRKFKYDQQWDMGDCLDPINVALVEQGLRMLWGLKYPTSDVAKPVLRFFANGTWCAIARIQFDNIGPFIETVLATGDEDKYKRLLFQMTTILQSPFGSELRDAAWCDA